MIKHSILLLALLVAAPAFAQTPPNCLAPIADPVPRTSARWSWVAPTTNTDNSVVKTPITYTIYEGATKICKIVTATAASWNNLSVGTHNYTVTATTSDGESAQSNVAIKTVSPAPPNPPTGLKVDPTSLMAYSPFKSGGQNLVTVVGTVALDTQCDVNNGVIVGGLVYSTVPISTVTFNNPAQAPNATAIVARCTG